MRKIITPLRCLSHPAIFLILLIFFPISFANNADNVKSAMELLKSQASTLGEPSLKNGRGTVPILLFGQTLVNGNYAIVDHVQAEKNCTATFFVKKDNLFVRISTNMRNENDDRAIGTILDPRGPVIAAINRGEDYFGEADILGKKYIAAYEPISNADEEIIGIYYAGEIKTDE